MHVLPTYVISDVIVGYVEHVFVKRHQHKGEVQRCIESMNEGAGRTRALIGFSSQWFEELLTPRPHLSL